MWAVASPNDLAYPTLDAALATHLEDIEGGTQPLSHKLTNALLGGKPARRLIVRWPAVGLSPARVEEYVVTFRSVRSGQVLYTLGLSVPDTDHARWAPVFAEFVATWEELP